MDVIHHPSFYPWPCETSACPREKPPILLDLHHLFLIHNDPVGFFEILQDWMQVLHLSIPLALDKIRNHFHGTRPVEAFKAIRSSNRSGFSRHQFVFIPAFKLEDSVCFPFEKSANTFGSVSAMEERSGRCPFPRECAGSRYR
jgi:hypothetical protein